MEKIQHFLRCGRARAARLRAAQLGKLIFAAYWQRPEGMAPLCTRTRANRSQPKAL